jgi:D-alanyl-D-alanine carboxypeptidase
MLFLIAGCTKQTVAQGAGDGVGTPVQPADTQQAVPQTTGGSDVTPVPPSGTQQAVSGEGADVTKVRTALERAVPQDIAARIMAAAAEPEFKAALDKALGGDPYLHYLVDKQHPLPDGYEPNDLVPLTNGVYQVSRNDLSLRQEAEKALAAMAAAAKKDGVTLIASSSFRSYEYQVIVYDRNVREMGQAAADRESARPGVSQHQTGLVVDFGSITDDFADTKAGRWISANASTYGWSLSFPHGYENITGYRWESWHYRYVGVDLARFIDTYFNGIQQYALQFLYEWER